MGSPGEKYAAQIGFSQYMLTRTGSTSSVMNNFWYLNGSFGSLVFGTGGTPSTVYITYDSGNNHVRIASFSVVDSYSIDGLGPFQIFPDCTMGEMTTVGYGSIGQAAGPFQTQDFTDFPHG